MTIHFQLSREELLMIRTENDSYITRTFADHAASQVYWSLMLPATVAAIGVVSGSFPVALFAFGLIWGVNFVGNRWYRARYVAKVFSAENLGPSLLPWKLELLEDRVVLSSTNVIHHHFWPGVRFVRETAGCFYLFFSPVSSLAVPKSAFASEEERETFRREVKAHLATGSGTQV